MIFPFLFPLLLLLRFRYGGVDSLMVVAVRERGVDVDMDMKDGVAIVCDVGW